LDAAEWRANGRTSTVDIRSARDDDLAAVVSLWQREGGPTSMPCGRAEVSTLLRRDPHGLLIAHDDVDVVGTLIVGWDGWRCHLYRLVVEPRCRREGIASRLVDEAKRRARALGAGKIEAIVVVDNAPAVAFWESQGLEFEPQNGRWTIRV
jgi:ribosomal protein S18 acetylase RimI-like enzyme